MKPTHCLAFVLFAVPTAAFADAPVRTSTSVVPPGEGAASLPPADERAADRERDKSDAEIAAEVERELGKVASPELEEAPEASDAISIFGRQEVRPRVAGSAHVVGQETLERYEYDDVHRILMQVPGVYVREEDGYGLRPNIGLRGASSDRSAKVTLMDDGVLLAPAPYAAPAAYFFPLTTRLVGVEVFKGPSSIKFGPNTIGGAINLVTRPIPEAMEAAVDLSYGLDRTGKLHGFWGAGDQTWGVLLEGVHLQSAGFKELDGGGDTGFDKNELVGQVRWQSDRSAEVSHRLTLRGGFADERSNETYLGITRADFAEAPYRRYAASANDRMTWWRSEVRASYVLEAGAFDLRVTAYRHDFHRVWHKVNGFSGGPSIDSVLADPNDLQNAVRYGVLVGTEDSQMQDRLLIGGNDRRFASQGLALVARGRARWFGIGQELEIGARLHQDSIERDHTEDGFAVLNGALIPSGDTMTTKQDRDAALAVALHAVDEVTIGDLTLTPGLRVEIIQTSHDDRLESSQSDRLDVVLIPGVGAYYQIADAVGVLAGVHRGFSPVAPGQPTTAEPESSTNYEAGVRLAFRDARTKAEAIGFFSDYSNVTGTCTFSSGCPEADLGTQFNAGAAWVYGLEAQLEQEVKLAGSLDGRLTVSYTFTQANFRSAFISGFPQFGSVEEGDELPYVPKHQLSVLTGLGSKRWNANLSVTYVGRMRDSASQGDIPTARLIPSHLVLDASAQYAVSRDGTLYVNGRNLLDSAYIVSLRPFGARPGMPLSLIVGYKHHFGG